MLLKSLIFFLSLNRANIAPVYQRQNIFCGLLQVKDVTIQKYKLTFNCYFKYSRSYWNLVFNFIFSSSVFILSTIIFLLSGSILLNGIIYFKRTTIQLLKTWVPLTTFSSWLCCWKINRIVPGYSAFLVLIFKHDLSLGNRPNLRWQKQWICFPCGSDIKATK